MIAVFRDGRIESMIEILVRLQGGKISRARLVQKLGDKSSGNVELGDLDPDYPTKFGGNRDFSSGAYIWPYSLGL